MALYSLRMCVRDRDVNIPQSFAALGYVSRVANFNSFL